MYIFYRSNRAKYILLTPLRRLSLITFVISFLVKRIRKNLSLLFSMVRQLLPFHFLFFSIVHNVKKKQKYSSYEKNNISYVSKSFYYGKFIRNLCACKVQNFFFGGFPVFLVINPRQQKLDETRTTTTYFLTVKRA